MPLPERFLHLPRAFWLLWLGALVNRLGGFVFTFLALYLTEGRGYTPLEAGTAVSLYGLGSFAAALFGGWLADRRGRRFGILFGTLTGTVTMLILGAVEPLWAIRIAALAAGFFGDSYRPSINAAVADVVPPEDRARAYSVLYWAFNLGFAVAASSAGWLVRFGYGWLFVADAATTLAFAIITFFFIKETKPIADASQEGPAIAWWEPFKNRLFLGFAAAQFVVILIFMQSQVSLPLAMHAHGIGAERYGTLIALNGFLILVLQPLASSLVRRTALRTLLAFGALLTALGFGMNALATSIPLCIVGIVLWTIGEIGFSAGAPAFVAKVAPVSARGVYQGAFHTLWGGAFALAPLIGTGVIERFSAQILWIGCLVLGLAAAVAHRLLPKV